MGQKLNGKRRALDDDLRNRELGQGRLVDEQKGAQQNEEGGGHAGEHAALVAVVKYRSHHGGEQCAGGQDGGERLGTDDAHIAPEAQWAQGAAHGVQHGEQDDEGDEPGPLRDGQLPFRGRGAPLYVGKRPGGGDEAGSATDDGHGVRGYLQFGAEGPTPATTTAFSTRLPARAITTWASFSRRAVSAG